MRRLLLAVACALGLAGCASDPNIISYKDYLAANNQNIQHLKLGMSKDEVMALMKTYSADIHGNPLPNPSHIEFVQRGKDVYEIMYYITHAHPPFTPIRDTQATPVVLKNGAVAGWGWPSVEMAKGGDQ